MSIDPMTFTASGGNPGYFNRYAYTFNDPINGIDPDGRQVVTAEERKMVDQGQVDQFWQSRTERGDPLGETGEDFGKPAGEQSTLVEKASGVLEFEIAKQITSEHSPEELADMDVDSMVTEKFNDARQSLAEAHVDKVDNDSSGRKNFLSAGQITDYHHQVFDSMGLPRDTFGGTMGTGTKLEGVVSGVILWCRECDGS